MMLGAFPVVDLAERDPGICEIAMLVTGIVPVSVRSSTSEQI